MQLLVLETLCPLSEARVPPKCSYFPLKGCFIDCVEPFSSSPNPSPRIYVFLKPLSPSPQNLSRFAPQSRNRSRIPCNMSLSSKPLPQSPIPMSPRPAPAPQSQVPLSHAPKSPCPPCRLKRQSGISERAERCYQCSIKSISEVTGERCYNAPEQLASYSGKKLTVQT